VYWTGTHVCKNGEKGGGDNEYVQLKDEGKIRVQ
jgi:hypothetical protein